MEAVTHLEKVIVGEVSAVTHIEKVIAGETSAVTYTEKVITGEAQPITHLQKVIAGEASPVTHLEYIWAGGSPTPTEHEYTGAVPYTFNADGSPLISWRISGNTVQNGTPTPQNPVIPQGCGDMTGNLAPPLSDWVDGYVDSNGTIAAPSDSYKEKSSDYISVKAGAAYTFSIENGFPNFPWRAIGWYTQDKTFISRASGNASDALYTNAPTNVVYCRLSYRTQGRTTNPMFNLGSTALPYEPYGYKLDISSASTTTPVYLGEVESTRRIKKYEFTGQENISQGSENYYTSLPTSGVPYSNMYCTHNVYGACSVNNNGGYIWLKISSWSDYTTAGDLKAFFQQEYAAGTPVTVWYVLATEETGIVNEPLMKIGDYADEVSNVATIPTNNGRTTIDVNTTVKPSEVYIKYKGV